MWLLRLPKIPLPSYLAGVARISLYARRRGAGGASAPRTSPKSWLRITHYTLLRKVVRQARHLCAQSAALMCLMGTPHTPLYAPRAVRAMGTSGGFPSPRLVYIDATDHEAFQPLRRRRGFPARPRCAAMPCNALESPVRLGARAGRVIVCPVRRDGLTAHFREAERNSPRCALSSSMCP